MVYVTIVYIFDVKCVTENYCEFLLIETQSLC